MQEQEDISIKDYIKEVLTQIGEAINECNSDNVANSKMIVNPARAEGKTFGNYTYAVNPKDQTHQRIVDIDFEISVAATKSKGVSGGLSVAALNLGGKNSKEIEAANKVKFTIPAQCATILPQLYRGISPRANVCRSRHSTVSAPSRAYPTRKAPRIKHP